MVLGVGRARKPRLGRIVVLGLETLAKEES